MPEFVDRFGEAYKAEVMAFIDCCVNRRPFPTTHRDGLRAQQVITMGMNSIVRFAGGAFGAQVSAAILAATLTASGFPTDHGFEVAFAIAAGAGAIGAALASLAPARHGRYA